MRKLLLINRILFLLSFLLPFFLFECTGIGFGPSKKEREVIITQAKQDSINSSVEAQRKADSVSNLNTHQIFQDSINSSQKSTKQDSLKTSELTNKIETNNLSVVKEKKDKIIYKLWEHMLFPTENSISALGSSILIIEMEVNYFNYKKFKIRDLLELLIPFNLLIALVLLLLIIFKKIKLSRIFSMISLLLLIVVIFHYHKQGILWGFWVAFILNMIDLVLVNLILFKPSQK